MTITSDPGSPIRPIGSDVTLTCTVELSSTVDVPVTVNTAWTGPAGFITTNTAQPVMGSITTYTSTAMVSSFGRDQSGNYICAVTANSTSIYITGHGSKSRTARVTVGKSLWSIVCVPVCIMNQAAQSCVMLKENVHVLQFPLLSNNTLL